VNNKNKEDQNRWLIEQRINEKIRRGIEELDRGEGIPEHRLDDYLKDLKAKPE
jgi:hypothetical protein